MLLSITTQNFKRIQPVVFVLLLSQLVTSFLIVPKSNQRLFNNHLSFTNQRQYYISSVTLYFGKTQLIDDEDEDDDDTDNLDSEVVNPWGEDGDDDLLTESSLQQLTISQLKQQLRLRGLKVTGKKQDLIQRLLGGGKYRYSPISTETEEDADVLPKGESTESKSTGSSSSVEFIDVTAYLDEDDKGKSVTSSIPPEIERLDGENTPSTNPEVWGTDALIVEDYERRSPVVDGLSRTVIQYRGSNQTMVQAYVVASRDAMKPFLMGGRNRTVVNADDPEASLREIQMKREQAEKRPVKFDDEEGLDEGDDPGYYKEALYRDFSDWGKYSLTGAQISAQEVQGVLILSDVYGPFTEATKNLAEKIAFECQPVVCMVPDMFRGDPWKEDATTPGFNDRGEEYEEWRSSHSDVRVSIDIRAAAVVLREHYGVSSVVVWGTCYGGGRALEAAAGYFPKGKVHDVDGAIGPAPVDPDVVIAWYPTRYHAPELFGTKKTHLLFTQETKRSFAVMGVFAGHDKLPGATPGDAAELKRLLAEDERVKDYMVKVFPGQDHGFAHNLLGRSHDESELDRFVDNEFGGAGLVSVHDGDAEVACLLSTAFMETYSRKFLPTTGDPISKDKDAVTWSDELNMKVLQKTNSRDVRQEIEDSLSNFKEMPLDGRIIDPTNEEEVLKALREMEPANQPKEYRIQDDDDVETAFAKLTAADENFQLF